MISRQEHISVSLSVRLVAGALIWLTLLLGLGGAVLAWAFRDAVEQEFARRLETVLRSMIAATELTPQGNVALTHPLGDPRFEQVFSGWYWQISESSGRRVRSRSLWDSALPEAFEHGGEVLIRRIAGPNGESLLVVERDLLLPDSPVPIHMLIAGDLAEVGAGTQRFDMLLIASLGLLGLGMAVAVLIQVRFGLRPLRAMKADLEAVREGMRHRLAGRYPREVSPLAEAMNGVLDNDAELIERARTHVGNLAHGLKTPLAVIQAELESGRDPEEISRQVQVMRRMVQYHLSRAAAIPGAGHVLGVRIPVDDVARRLVHALERIYAERRLEISVQVESSAAFRGQREDLEEILGNLMDNACKWAARQVLMTGRRDGGGIALTVEDDGPGLSPAQAEEAATRGKRLDEQAPGWGLGLSIVSDLVAANGGSVAFERSSLGGLKVVIRISQAGNAS